MGFDLKYLILIYLEDSDSVVDDSSDSVNVYAVFRADW